MEQAHRAVGTGAHMFAFVQLCRELKIIETINSLLTWDEDRTNVTPGHRVVAMLVNLLGEWGHLYGVEKFLQDADIRAVMGDEFNPLHFNDDALARGLDMISDFGGNKLYSSIALSCVALEKVEAKFLHADTTSYSVCGEYCDQEPESTFKINYGYSKDHRTDLKQFMIGLVTNSEGIPVAAQMLSGNTADCKWNGETLKAVEELRKGPLGQDFVYVADCKLVTTENLRLISEKPGMSFLSLLPKGYKVGKELCQAAWASEEWNRLEETAPDKDAPKYRTQSYEAELDGRQYRFMVTHSRALEGLKAKSTAKAIIKDELLKAKTLAGYARRKYDSEAAAQTEYDGLTMEFSKSGFGVVGGPVRVEETKHGKQGRPSKDAQPELTEHWKLVADLVAPSPEYIARQVKLASTFVLITNLRDSKQYTDADLLRHYKGQIAVEQRFRFIKDPTFVNAVYLHKPERVEAFGYVILLAALVAMLLQRRVRRSLAEVSETVEVKGKIQRSSPTIARIMEELKEPLTILVWENEDSPPIRIWLDLSANTRKILYHAGMTPAQFRNRFIGIT